MKLKDKDLLKQLTYPRINVTQCYIPREQNRRG
jgi:hypothetical protein